MREARVARKIQDPNVATLYELSGLPDGSFYMVWEFIDGKNLGTLIRERGPLGSAKVIDLSIQTLRGLDAIHRAGFIHRDISPDNLMITRDERGQEVVKIIDLGIAKQERETGDTLTVTGQFIGKLKYASPEQLGFLPPDERIDARSDLYSLGIVMYEMLTGRAPFTAATPQQYVLKHLKEPPPSIDGAPELAPLIARALAKDRKQRFSSAAQFAEVLKNIDRGQNVATPAPKLEETQPATTQDLATLPTISLTQRDLLEGSARSGSTDRRGMETVQAPHGASHALRRRRGGSPRRGAGPAECCRRPMPRNSAGSDQAPREG